MKRLTQSGWTPHTQGLPRSFQIEKAALSLTADLPSRTSHYLPTQQFVFCKLFCSESRIFSESKLLFINQGDYGNKVSSCDSLVYPASQCSLGVLMSSAVRTQGNHTHPHLTPPPRHLGQQQNPQTPCISMEALVPKISIFFISISINAVLFALLQSYWGGFVGY